MRAPVHYQGGVLFKFLSVIGNMGHAWVIVFFVMSGYLVGGSVLRSVTTGRWSWRSYLFARMTRLYMVLLPALLLGGLLDLYSIHQFGKADFYTTVDPGHEDPSPNDSLPTLVGNSLFLQTIKIPLMGGAFVQSFGSNQPLWSLCNEFWYYIAFLLLVLPPGKDELSLRLALIRELEEFDCAPALGRLRNHRCHRADERIQQARLVNVGPVEKGNLAHV